MEFYTADSCVVFADFTRSVVYFLHRCHVSSGSKESVLCLMQSRKKWEAFLNDQTENNGGKFG